MSQGEQATGAPNLEEIIDECVEVILLVQGRNAQGRSFWAYAAMPPGRLEAFRAAEAAGPYRLDEWARILRSGSGRQPPDPVRAEMEASHGALDDFERRVRALAALEPEDFAFSAW